MLCVPMSNNFHWRELLPNRLSIAIMALFLVIAEHLRYKEIVLFPQ